jgi:hypothetical protein
MMPHYGRYIPAHLVVARGDLDAGVDIYKASKGVIKVMDDPYLAGELNGEWAMLCLYAVELDAAREKLNILLEMGEKTQHAILLSASDWMRPRGSSARIR